MSVLRACYERAMYKAHGRYLNGCKKMRSEDNGVSGCSAALDVEETGEEE